MFNVTSVHVRHAMFLGACIGIVFGLLAGMVLTDLHTIGMIKAMDTAMDTAGIGICRYDSN